MATNRQLRQNASRSSKSRQELVKESDDQKALVKINFQIMAVAAILIVGGFLLMLGGGSTPEEFNPDIFSTRRIIIGPTISFIGFLLMAVGIIYRPGRFNFKKNK